MWTLSHWNVQNQQEFLIITKKCVPVLPLDGECVLYCSLLIRNVSPEQSCHLWFFLDFLLFVFLSVCCLSVCLFVGYVGLIILVICVSFGDISVITDQTFLLAVGSWHLSLCLLVVSAHMILNDLSIIWFSLYHRTLGGGSPPVATHIIVSGSPSLNGPTGWKPFMYSHCF